MKQDDEEPHITNLEDGSVRIQIGEHVGFVSSFHLIEPKVRQIRAAINRAEQSNT